MKHREDLHMCIDVRNMRGSIVPIAFVLKVPIYGPYALGKGHSDGHYRDAIPVIDANEEATSLPVDGRNCNGRLVFSLLPGMRPAPCLWVRRVGDPRIDAGGDWVYDSDGYYLGEWL